MPLLVRALLAETWGSTIDLVVLENSLVDQYDKSVSDEHLSLLATCPRKEKKKKTGFRDLSTPLTHGLRQLFPLAAAGGEIDGCVCRKATPKHLSELAG